MAPVFLVLDVRDILRADEFLTAFVDLKLWSH
jgi:hypothetical protein